MPHEPTSGQGNGHARADAHVNEHGYTVQPGFYVPDWVPPGWPVGAPLPDLPEVRAHMARLLEHAERVEEIERRYNRARRWSLVAIALMAVGAFFGIGGVPAALFGWAPSHLTGIAAQLAILLGNAIMLLLQARPPLVGPRTPFNALMVLATACSMVAMFNFILGNALAYFWGRDDLNVALTVVGWVALLLGVAVLTVGFRRRRPSRP